MANKTPSVAMTSMAMRRRVLPVVRRFIELDAECVATITLREVPLGVL